MNTKQKIAVCGAGVVMVLVITAVWLGRPRWSGIAHQRPYKWDQYAVPTTRFTNAPIMSVVKTVNDIVRSMSNGEVQQVVLVDTNPVQIVRFPPSVSIDKEMDAMIQAFRDHEQEMLKRGADGFETGFYTGQIGGGHSLGCVLSELAIGAGLGYREKKDGIHIRREPSQLECRAYRISSGLVALMEQKRKANDLHVDAEPIVSALAQATGIHSWSIMVPDGPNSATGEFRFGKVFRHLPQPNLILALATPEEHSNAVERLKADGLWVAFSSETIK